MKTTIKSVSIAIALLLTCVLFACIPANPGGKAHGKDCDCEACMPPVVHGKDCECEICKPPVVHGDGCDCEECVSSVVHGEDCDCEECKPEYVPKGTFYGLQEAFDRGWLTQNEVRSIAYYHNSNYLGDGMEIVYIERSEEPDFSFWLLFSNSDGSCSGWAERITDYVPIPKKPEILSEEIEKNLKEVAAYYARLTTPTGVAAYPNPIAENYFVISYYGVYSDCYAVLMGVKSNETSPGGVELTFIAETGFILDFNLSGFYSPTSCVGLLIANAVS
ncbi:MAG: hypothetical protein FWD58_02640 [Firmicutes bacterium]|nr:hypothetical protein [Bacillota bacterium]